MTRRPLDWGWVLGLPFVLFGAAGLVTATVVMLRVQGCRWQGARVPRCWCPGARVLVTEYLPTTEG